MGEAYNAGYRAGHLQGWRDALASAAASAAPAAPQPAQPEPVAPEPAAPRPPAGQPSWLSQGPVRLPSPPAYRAVSPQAISPQREAELRAEREKARERREQQNINVTLYVASLLLVAAGALFIGTALPVPLKFAGVCTITALFYTAGLMLHKRAPRLKPAAVAFSGTGLALIPVTGLALYTLVLHHAPLAWLITSVVGTAAYVLAALRLESRVLVYLSLTFVASTAWSGVSVLGGALMWYFTALIGVAVFFTLLAILKPGWLPPLYLRPLAQLHPFMVPAVAVAATMVPLMLGRGDYARIMAMCGCYFAVMAVAPGAGFRTLQFLAARASLTVAAAVAVWNLSGRGSTALAAAAVLLAVQAVLTFMEANRLPALLAGILYHRRWRLDLAVTFGLQLSLTAAFAVAEALEFFYQPSEGDEGLPLLGLTVLALLTGMVLAARHRGAAEWAPVAALGLAILLADPLGAWSLTGLLIAGAAYWILRSLPAAEPLRLHFVLAARIALTLAAPVLTAAIVGQHDARFSAAAFALCIALVLQQLATAVLIRRQIPALAPQLSLALFTTAGAGTMTVLALDQDERAVSLSTFLSGTFLTAVEDLGFIAIGAQLLASLAVGLMLVPRYGNDGPWRPTVAEAVPLAVSLAAVPLAFDTLSLPLGNAALLLVTGYLAVTAVRAGTAPPPGEPTAESAGRTSSDGATLRRRCYWWFSRAAATALVLTLFHQLQHEAGPVVVGGEAIAASTVFAVALSLQLAIPLRTALRGREQGRDLADAGVLLALQAAAIMSPEASVRAFDSEPASWQATLTTLLLAGGAAGAGYLLRRQRWSAVFAPAGLALLLLLRGESLPHVEILLGLFAVFCAAMVVAVEERIARGGYFAAARILTAALALVLSYDVSASSTVVAVTFAFVFAAQHVIRWLMRHRLTDVPFQQAAVWITLAGQAILPAAYMAQPFREDISADDGGRWVVLLSLVLLLLSAVAAGRLFAARGAAYLAIYAALFGVVALGPLLPFQLPFTSAFLAAPVLSHTGVAFSLLGMSFAATAGGVLFRHRNVEGADHWLWLTAAGSFGTASAMLAPPSGDWISGVAVIALSAACFVASHVERVPGFYPPAVLAALAGATMAADGLVGDVPGPWGFYLPWLAGCGTAAAALYAAAWIRSRVLLDRAPQAEGPPTAAGGSGDVRHLSLVGAAVLGLAAAGLVGLLYSATSWTGAALVTGTAVVMWLEVPAAMHRPVAELGALAVTAAVQRAALFVPPVGQRPSWLDGVLPDDTWREPLLPDPFWPDPFWTAQWYVVLAAVLGVLRYRSGHTDAGKLYLGLASGLLSLTGLLVIFGGDGAQQLWVLAFFAALLVAGMGYGERMFVWWGAAGVALCIMWAMRQYTYVLLALIAAGLIALALWKLSRSKPAGSE
ncbi:hypothetical protein J7E80_10195 [Arthrobacter sp. ISL-28]|nr:hypothetical protein [Arthrobacter sp. ISL-28]